MTKKPKKSGSQAEGIRGSLWRFAPDELTIVGFDTDEQDHELCDHESNAFDAEHYDEYIQYMRLNGVDKPILFRRDGKRNLIVEGRTTTRVARIVAPLWEKDRRAEGLKGDDCKLTIPAVLRRGTADELFCVSRATNRRRPGSDSHDIDAKAIAKLTNNGATVDQAAVRLGLPLARAKQLVAYLQLHPKLQRKVGAGVSLDAAVKLAKLPQADQVARMSELEAAGEKPTAARVQNKLREANGKAPVETAAQKLKAIRDLVDAYQTSLLHMNPEDQDDSHAQALRCLTQIRKIVYPPAVDGTPEADRPRPTNRELHPEDYKPAPMSEVDPGAHGGKYIDR